MFKTQLLSYQTQSVQKLEELTRRYGYAMLEAGMGTGKTIMALALYDALKPKRLVVVAPKTLLSTWQNQIEQHTDFKVSMVWDSVKAGADGYKRQMSDLSLAGGIFLVNIEAFQRDNAQLLKFLDRWTKGGSTMLVVDESSKVKDQSAHRTKAVAKAFVSANWKLCMTGTMNANSPLDVFGQFLVLNRDFWKIHGYRTWQIFQAEFGILQEFYGPNGTTFKKVVGYRRLNELRSIIEPFLVVVDKAKVLDLPEKVWEQVTVKLSKEERRAYDDMKRDMMTMLSDGTIIAADQAMSLYNKFRMLTGGWIETGTPIVERPAKLQALCDILEDTDEQVLIFANYTHEVDQLTSALSESKRYDGSISMEDRSTIVASFNNGDTKYIVAQPIAGAYGLNLQARCNTVIYYSRPNSPEVFQQSQDRIHRMGQSKTCYYIDLVAENTIDGAVIVALEKKEDLSKIFRHSARHSV